MSDTTSSPVPAPPVVYLPVKVDAEREVTEFCMMKLGDGRVALLGYTALDRFIDCCGETQPWLLFETDKLDAIRQTKHFDLKFLDVAIPEELRSREPEVTA